MGPQRQLPRVNSVPDKNNNECSISCGQEVKCYPNVLPPPLHIKRATLFHHINDTPLLQHTMKEKS